MTSDPKYMLIITCGLPLLSGNEYKSGGVTEERKAVFLLTIIV